MENEEFLGPKTGDRSGPGGPGVACMVSGFHSLSLDSTAALPESAFQAFQA